MIITVLFLLLFSHQIHTGLIQLFNSSNFNETEASQPLVIFNNNYTDINNDGNQSTIPVVDKNQFAETVVDMLLDLLEKANLSRTVSLIHNETELTELVEQDDDTSKTTTTTVKLSDA